jgi:hypothetical protein
VAETTDWSGFDTGAHRAAQAGCNHLIHCAVDAATRAAVSHNLDNARSTGDPNGIVILLAPLAGPCCLPPVNPPKPGTPPPATAPHGAPASTLRRTGDNDETAI